MGFCDGIMTPAEIKTFHICIIMLRNREAANSGNKLETLLVFLSSSLSFLACEQSYIGHSKCCLQMSSNVGMFFIRSRFFSLIL